MFEFDLKTFEFDLYMVEFIVSKLNIYYNIIQSLIYSFDFSP